MALVFLAASLAAAALVGGGAGVVRAPLVCVVRGCSGGACACRSLWGRVLVPVVWWLSDRRAAAVARLCVASRWPCVAGAWRFPPLVRRWLRF